METPPVIIEITEPNPVIIKKMETVPVIIENMESVPVLIAKMEANPVITKNMETVTDERMEPATVTIEKIEPVPAIIEEMETVPVVIEKMETVPVIIEEIEPVPVIIEEIEPVPVINEDIIDSVPVIIQKMETVLVEEKEPVWVIIEEIEPAPVKIEEIEPVPVKIPKMDPAAAKTPKMEMKPVPVTKNVEFIQNILRLKGLDWNITPNLYELEPSTKYNHHFNSRRHRIVKSFEVRNPFLMAMFLLKKAEMKRLHGCAQEMYVFHGTKSARMDPICKENFNHRLCGSSTGTKFGRGVSFSPESFYAWHYCEKFGVIKEMLLCKVLYMSCHTGDRSTEVPNIGFDTTTNGKKTVYVKYDDDVFYPICKILFV